FVNVVAAPIAVVMLLGAAVSAQSPRATLHGSAPAWAKSNNYVGSPAADDSVGFRMYLGWTDSDAAQSLARAVADPRSSSYRAYLTSAQFRKQFAPAQSQVGAVQSWLKRQGFSVVDRPA